MADPHVHVITILWGTAYSERDVNNLYGMIARNTTLPFTFHLFSDETLADLRPEIVRHAEPGLAVNRAYLDRYAYRKEAGLCDDALGELTGQRVFFFDLDVVIMDDLDELFRFPEGDGFYVINDWNTKGDHVGQASCYSFVVGTLGFVKSEFEANPEPFVARFGTASQEYLSFQVIKKYGKLNFWPENWCQSFRFHCLPPGPLRHFATPKKPKPGTKVLAFHGHPDIQSAIAGRWSAPGAAKAARGFKKLYKACRPTPWVKAYWEPETGA